MRSAEICHSVKLCEVPYMLGRAQHFVTPSKLRIAPQATRHRVSANKDELGAAGIGEVSVLLNCTLATHLPLWHSCTIVDENRT